MKYAWIILLEGTRGLETVLYNDETSPIYEANYHLPLAQYPSLIYYDRVHESWQNQPLSRYDYFYIRPTLFTESKYIYTAMKNLRVYMYKTNYKIMPTLVDADTFRKIPYEQLTDIQKNEITYLDLIK